MSANRSARNGGSKGRPGGSGGAAWVWWVLALAAVIALVVGIEWWVRHHRAGGPVAAAQVLGIPGDCPPEGDARSERMRELNRLKNRLEAPPDGAVRPDITLAAMLAPGEDEGRFRTSDAAEVTGYVVSVHVGGVESCNCHARDPEGRDTHIELVPSPEQEVPERRIIVEVTPNIRRGMAARGADWSTRALREALPGHWVRVRGWMLYDEEHRAQSFNTAPRNETDWRATGWEIHPVTSIQVVR